MAIVHIIVGYAVCREIDIILKAAADLEPKRDLD
jgi:hypothetical protein